MNTYFAPVADFFKSIDADVAPVELDFSQIENVTGGAGPNAFPVGPK